MIQPTEHQIQVAYVTFCQRLERIGHPALKLAFAVPNGGLRNKMTAIRLKQEGVRAGVPDWMLPVPRKGFNGLAIEFKTKTGRLSKEQSEYLTLLAEHGNWLTVVCRDTQSAIDTLRSYLEI